MSRIFRNNEGGLYVAQGSDLYFLTEWIEGKYIDFSQGEQLDAASNLLADMHRMGEGFDPPKECLARNDLGRWPSKWHQRITDLKIMAELSQRQKDDFDQVFCKLVNICLEEAYQALNIIKSAGYTEYCRSLSDLKPLCHRDFVYHNLIFNGSGAFLIDFEYCIQDSRVIDLARFIRTSFVEYPWEVDTAQRIITGYQERYPLTITEEKMLLAVLMFPHDIWRTGHKWYFSQQRNKSIYHFLCQQCRFYNHKYQVWRKLEQGFLSR